MKIRNEFRDEKDLSNYCVSWLRHLGYIVRVTSTNTREKRQVRALADLLIRHPTWERGRWLAVEMKNPNGWKYSSPEQETAALQGETIVVDSWLALCDALEIEPELQASLIH